MSASKDDRGVTTIFLAVTLVGLMALVGLVIDGSNAYAQRRQMQNAADTAATAGTNALQLFRQGEVTAEKIWVEALAAGGANGAKTDTSFICELVRLDSSGTEIGTVACPTTSAGPVPGDAFGVRITAESDHVTSFIRVVGIDGFSAQASAAALVRKALPGVAPFMVCANAAGHPVPLLIVDPLNEDDAVINDAAIGEEYVIWGNDIKSGGRDCGNPSSSFRGLVDLDLAPYDLPGEWQADQGNKGGHMLPNVAGGCGIADGSKVKDTPVGCEFALPLCTRGNDLPGNNFVMHCVAMGRFRVTSNGAPHRIEAEFLGGGVAPGGAGGGVPSLEDVVVIKLSE